MKTLQISILIMLALVCSCNQDNLLLNNAKAKSDTINSILKNDEIKNLSKSRFDFLIDKINNLNNDSIKVLKLNELSDKYFETDSVNRFFEVSKLLLNHSIVNKDTINIAKGNINIGTYYLKKNLLDSAFYYFNKAEGFYIAKNDVDNISKTKVKKAQIQYYKNDFLASELSILNVLRYFETNKDYVYLNVCYTVLGLTKIELNEIDEGIENLNKALLYARNFEKNDDLLIYEKNNLGLAYIKKFDYLRALFYYNQLFNDITKELDLEIFLKAKQYIAYSKFKLGNKNDFEKNFLELIKEYENNNFYVIIPKIQLSEYYKSINEIKKAQNLALEAYKTSLTNKIYRSKLQALKQLSEVFPEKYKYYTDEYVKLKDSIADVDKKTSNTFARIEYRVDELSNENIQLERKNKNFILYGFISAMIVSLIIVGYLLYQSKKSLNMSKKIQKGNEDLFALMTLQQVEFEKIKIKERNRIAKELHDGIMNKLTAIRFNLFPLQHNPSLETIQKSLKYIDSLHDVEQELRDLSHELNELNIFIKDASFGDLIQSIYQPQEDSTTNINFTIEQSINWNTIDTTTKLNVYRILQETISNALKHAKANLISIEVIEKNKQLMILIEDDGIGFEISEHKNGIGLKNCHERIEELKGEFSIISRPNNGTKINLIIPIGKDHE